MMCVYCRTGMLRGGTTTVTLERNGSIIVFKGVPALVCNQCGESYTDEDVTEILFDMAEREINKSKVPVEAFLQYPMAYAKEA